MPLKQMLNEDNALEIRRKRLLFRSWHRGCKETDLILGSFAERELPVMNVDDLTLFEALLEEDDADIWAWLTEKAVVPKPDFEPLIDRLRHYRQ